ncbi:MAG: hypothetical protein BRC30_02715 [Nanohaloarchaea archaeon SW_7_46_7]|nr:MAG: hypothetical protein BRC30_02715 [Nanohaloarchaea archaeon SW_7_46_7]
MEFENESAEKAYKTIANSSGIGLYELVSRPGDYRDVMHRKDSLTPEDLDKNDQALRALEILEEAGLVMKNGDFQTYDVASDPEVYEETLEKLQEKGKHLV